MSVADASLAMRAAASFTASAYLRKLSELPFPVVMESSFLASLMTALSVAPLPAFGPGSLTPTSATARQHGAATPALLTKTRKRAGGEVRATL